MEQLADSLGDCCSHPGLIVQFPLLGCPDPIRCFCTLDRGRDFFDNSASRAGSQSSLATQDVEPAWDSVLGVAAGAAGSICGVVVDAVPRNQIAQTVNIMADTPMSREG